MNLEADQAVQEVRFAGACQDQHAGRPAPNLGWPGERKSIVQKAETRRFSKPIKVTGPGARVRKGLGPRAWGRGLHKVLVVLKKSPGGGKRRGGRRVKRLPGRWGPGGKRYLPAPFHGCKVSPSPLLKPSNTPPKVGGCSRP